ncbi:MAG TPA: hypothetical protein GXX38_01915 [Clostridia bacterium]|jgi:hypothetical protein|nr:hypothetical protein [Clostridia bacterium]
MFDKVRIVKKIREELNWAKNMNPEDINKLLIPLNKENSLFLFETPEEDLGLSVREKGTDIEIQLLQPEDLFTQGDRITMNMQELYRFIDVD